MEFYSGAENRGYLSDPAEVAEAKLRLAQKYGYSLTEEQMSGDEENIKKDPRQIFLGLEPGWLINLSDSCIYKPEDEVLEEVYKS